MEYVISVLLILALGLAVAFGRMSSGASRARRTKTPPTVQPQQSAGAPSASAAPQTPTLPHTVTYRQYYPWLTLAASILFGVIAVAALMSWLNSPVSIMPGSPAPAIRYPKFPSTPGEMWWILISVPSLSAIALLLRKQGTQPHLTPAAVLAIFAIVVFGLWLIQSGGSKETPHASQSTRTPAPQQSRVLEQSSEWTGPGQTVYVAQRRPEWGKQRKIFIPPFGYKFETNFESTERCGLEALVNDTIVVPNAHTEPSLNKFVPHQGSAYTVRYRPTDCDTVILRIKVERVETNRILSQ